MPYSGLAWPPDVHRVFRRGDYFRWHLGGPTEPPWIKQHESHGERAECGRQDKPWGSFPLQMRIRRNPNRFWPILTVFCWIITHLHPIFCCVRVRACTFPSLKTIWNSKNLENYFYIFLISKWFQSNSGYIPKSDFRSGCSKPKWF